MIDQEQEWVGNMSGTLHKVKYARTARQNGNTSCPTGPRTMEPLISIGDLDGGLAWLCAVESLSGADRRAVRIARFTGRDWWIHTRENQVPYQVKSCQSVAENSISPSRLSKQEETRHSPDEISAHSRVKGNWGKETPKLHIHSFMIPESRPVTLGSCCSWPSTPWYQMLVCDEDA